MNDHLSVNRWAWALAWSCIALPGLSAAAGTGAAKPDDASACSITATLLYDACGAAAQSAWLVRNARCFNLRDNDVRRQCRKDSQAGLDDAQALCLAQKFGRGDACAVLGEQRYDPPFEQKRFDRDPRKPSMPNIYFPVRFGYHWEYHGGGEFNTVDMLDATKLIDGVRCLVVRDLVYDDKGRVTEATDDWIATARDGAVWYCGEEVKEYAYTHGDHPRAGELVSINGSFKQGRHGAKAGMLMPASPVPGQAYREEAALAHAEDYAEVLSVDYSYGKDSDLDRYVPQALAEFLCANDCVVTRNVSQLEPGITERKYYARGIGVFAETTVGKGLDAQLTACNVDPRCASLPH